MSDMNCPYCNDPQTVCHDDGAGYKEDQRHEHTCTECGKTFVFTTFISFSYTPRKADCLNEGDHVLKMSNTFPRRYAMMRCKDCDYQRHPTEHEFSEAFKAEGGRNE